MGNYDLIYILKHYSGPDDHMVFLFIMGPIFVGIFAFLFMRIFDHLWWETCAKICKIIWIATAFYYVAVFFWVASIVLKNALSQP